MLMFYLSMMDNEEERSFFEKRYIQFKHDCLRVANLMLKDVSLAEDAVHEAFMSIIKHRKKYLALSCRDFRSAIVIIVRNKCFDILRKNKRMPGRMDEEFENMSDDSQNVEEIIIRRADVHEASKYLNKIDEISRQVLYMKYIQGLTYKEIGQALSLNEKNVEVRIYRAKKKVRNMMVQGGDANG